MNILLADHQRRSIRVVKLSKRSSETLDIDIKGEICRPTTTLPNNHVTKILTFKFQNNFHLVILRSNGSIQLYTKTANSKYYTLFKDWKNNLMNSHTDMIVALDVLNNQYLYSCSRDGKLIIRDLINDDADKSYEVFMLMDGIGKIDLKLDKFTNTISVATCGKNSDLRLYTIDLELDNASKGNSKDPDQSDLTYVQSFRNRPLRRSFTTLSLEAPFLSAVIPPPRNTERRHSKVLTPYWQSITPLYEYVYNSDPTDQISQWMSSVCFVKGNDYIICGSQMGELIIYNPVKDISPVFKKRISQFSIQNIEQIDSDLIIFSDSMSRIIIFSISKRKIVLQFSQLDFGPFLHLKYILPNAFRRKTNNQVVTFDDIYVLSTTIDQRLVVYKLTDSGSSELLLSAKILKGMIFSATLLQSVSEYDQFRNLFGGDDEGPSAPTIIKKRKLSSNSYALMTNNNGSGHSQKSKMSFIETQDNTLANTSSSSSQTESEDDNGESFEYTNVEKHKEATK
ncbi:Hap43p-repressed protein [Candida albicans SC5314]|nr:Hap43p-repressed protein [Candida albicans SC5314]